MESMTDRLNKLREERLAREKARIEKLRELNLKKYSKAEYGSESILRGDAKNSSYLTIGKSVKSEINLKHSTGAVKNNFHVNGTTKRPISVPSTKPNLNKELTKPRVGDVVKSDVKVQSSNIPKASHVNPVNMDNKLFNGANANKKAANNPTNIHKKPANSTNTNKKVTSLTTDKTLKVNEKKIASNDKNITVKSVSHLPKSVQNADKKQNFAIRKADSSTANVNVRKSLAVTNDKPKPNVGRKSMIPKMPTSGTKSSTQCSVFERLYKPKPAHTHVHDVEKLHTDPNYLKKVIQTSGLILNKRHTVFEANNPRINHPDKNMRRSISAVHFKRIGKQELGNCIHKWSSIGDKLNNVHLKHINEDENVKEDRVVSAVKSERKKVTFMTPTLNFNTPRPEELQARLKSWLQKRGKSLDSYHHLQCFGIHHLPHRIKFDTAFDEENKENIAVESDSDNDSYTENMNEEVENVNKEEWRTASSVSEKSMDFNESHDTTLTCSDQIVVNLDEVVVGALIDLTELLKEGFDWEQCARWLRAIRERFPSAPHSAAYWECRAALEERRGDLPASVQCWEEAIAKGTEHSVVEANLDHLLDKFMQLKISPNSGKRKQVDPKLVDVKNVFKSTIIRFAVQQAKLRQSNQFGTPKFTVTPVRRSGRLSAHFSGKRTPLQVCTSVRQAAELFTDKPVFVPNDNLCGTP